MRILPSAHHTILLSSHITYRHINFQKHVRNCNEEEMLDKDLNTIDTRMIPYANDVYNVRGSDYDRHSCRWSRFAPRYSSSYSIDSQYKPGENNGSFEGITKLARGNNVEANNSKREKYLAGGETGYVIVDRKCKPETSKIKKRLIDPGYNVSLPAAVEDALKKATSRRKLVAKMIQKSYHQRTLITS